MRQQPDQFINRFQPMNKIDTWQKINFLSLTCYMLFIVICHLLLYAIYCYMLFIVICCWICSISLVDSILYGAIQKKLKLLCNMNTSRVTYDPLQPMSDSTGISNDGKQLVDYWVMQLKF